MAQLTKMKPLEEGNGFCEKKSLNLKIHNDTVDENWKTQKHTFVIFLTICWKWHTIFSVLIVQKLSEFQ